ncbi:hypothetical protein OAB57_03250 [Bacteriovoracaceae bacterium]|nr:hypothetical protein [Bacteriovoracaceae bacterium]
MMTLLCCLLIYPSQYASAMTCFPTRTSKDLPNKPKPELDPLFGAEFTFTNHSLINDSIESGENSIETQSNLKAQLSWAKFMKDKCQNIDLNCEVNLINDLYPAAPHYHVRYGDGFWYNITLDPAVVEITMKPITVSEMSLRKEQIQDDIFNTASKLKLFPHSRIGAGHIHMDLKSSIRNDTLLLRNLFVDMTNHHFISLGGLGMYPNNAPPISLLTVQQRKAFKKIVNRKYLLGKYKDVKGLAKAITKEVYLRNGNNTKYSPIEKYQSINLTRVFRSRESERTIEFRSFFPETSAEVFLENITLLKSRMNLLSNINRPIVLKKIPSYGKEPFLISNVPQISRCEKQELVNQLHQYVKQSGYDWDLFEKRLGNSFEYLIPQTVPDKILCHRGYFRRKEFFPLNKIYDWVISQNDSTVQEELALAL